MSRLIFLIAIVAAIYLLVRSYRKNASLRDETAIKEVTEDMVRCAHCGVHLPKSESVQAAGAFFCSTAHRDAFRQ